MTLNNLFSKKYNLLLTNPTRKRQIASIRIKIILAMNFYNAEINLTTKDKSKMNAKESIMKFVNAGITGLAHVTGGSGGKGPKPPKFKSGSKKSHDGGDKGDHGDHGDHRGSKGGGSHSHGGTKG